jgi:hypothetical protein
VSARTPIKYQKCYKLSQCVLARYSSYYGVPKSCTLVFPFHCFLPSRILLPQFWHILHAAHSRPCHASFISEYRVSREFGSEHFLWETLCIVTSPSILHRSVVSYVLEVYHPSRHKYAWVDNSPNTVLLFLLVSTKVSPQNGVMYKSHAQANSVVL